MLANDARWILTARQCLPTSRVMQVPASAIGNGAIESRRGQKAVLWLARLGRRIVVEQRQRRAIRQLQALDDRMLADIGLRRGEIESAARGVTMS
ncbi:MAG: DUF1127 domain-containing protein [Xanthobacteraceae bacterium]